MKKIYLLTLMILLIGVLIFVGCAQPAPAPAPAPKPAPAPSPTAKPSPPPSATVSPAPTPAKPIEIRFAHHNPPTGRTTVKGLTPFARKIEEATGGRVKVIEYPAESLARSKETLEATMSGLADMSWNTTGNWPGRFPLTEVVTLPFLSLTSGKAEGRTLSAAAVNSRILQELYETVPEVQAEHAGLKVLFLHTSDAYFLATSKKPVRNQADVKGLKIRALGGPPSDMWKLLGAIPVLLPMSDTYDAAQKGIIDGMAMPWAPVTTHRLYEIFKFRTELSTTIASFHVIMNLEKWNSLPPDIQQAIMSVSGKFGSELISEGGFGLDAEKDTRDIMQKQGYKFQEFTLDPGEYEQWVKIAGKPLWDKWIAEMNSKGLPGQKVFNEALRIMEKYK